MMTTPKTIPGLCAAACIAGAAAMLPAVAWAHDEHAHGGAMSRAPMAHAAHLDHSAHPAQMAKSTADEYQRSERDYAIPDVVLTDANAKPVRLRELLASGDPVMLNFIFTTCGTICPVMSRIFADVPAALGAEAKALRMVSISIDPQNDTPARLKAYAERFEAGPRWEFLTGSVQDVKAVQLAFDSYRGDKMNHEPLTLLRAAAGKPWVRIDGYASVQALAGELRRAVTR